MRHGQHVRDALGGNASGGDGEEDSGELHVESLGGWLTRSLVLRLYMREEENDEAGTGSKEKESACGPLFM